MKYSKILDSQGNKIPLRASANYSAASTGRRMHTWGISTAGPNAALYGNLSTLRSRSRQLVRNDPYADDAIDTLAANFVGTGITPTWLLADKDMKEKIRLLWSDWVPEADADGVCDFYGLQALAARSFVMSGEVFVRFRPRRLSDGLAVPLQLQVLEADHLDAALTQTESNGNQTRMGIEFDRLGRRVAYHFYREHPGEQFFNEANSSLRVRVPASEVLHIYLVERPGQKRGKPWMASVIVTAHDLGDFDDAQLVKQKIAAMYVGFLTKGFNPDQIPGAPVGEQAPEGEEDSPVITMEPGTMNELDFGEDVKFSDPPSVGDSYKDFTERQDRRCAAGYGLTYEKYTGDLSGVNYSSIRAGNLEFQRKCKQIINNVLIFQMCRPVADYWLDQAVLSGAIEIPGFARERRKYRRIKWNGDGWEWVDPVKEVNAKQMAVRSGFKSRTQVVNESGRDVEDVDAEIAEDNQRADDNGLVLDSDPRKTAKTGNYQETEETREDKENE